MSNTVQYEELRGFIEETKAKPGPLIPIMQKAQDIFGALGVEVQGFIAEEMQIPVSDIYGVATFYSQFSLEPKGKYVVGVCLGTACYVRKADGILNSIAGELQIPPGCTTPDKLFTLEATRCLGCCGLAPVIMINDNVYGRLVPEDIPGILKNYQE